MWVKQITGIDLTCQQSAMIRRRSKDSGELEPGNPDLDQTAAPLLD